MKKNILHISFGIFKDILKYKCANNEIYLSEIEPHNRGVYGGCIGFIGLNGALNQAITIRTFVSRNNELWFQAGGGITALSNEENELQEVNNKLGALKKAILLAEQL
jgi:anthranilate synthase component 1